MVHASEGELFLFLLLVPFSFLLAWGVISTIPEALELRFVVIFALHIQIHIFGSARSNEGLFLPSFLPFVFPN